MGKKIVNYKSLSAWVLCCLAVGVLSSCIGDKENDCGVNLRFRYTYNVNESDAFAHEVGQVHVWVFDSNNRFMWEYTEEGNHIGEDYRMRLTDLPTGEYKFVAWARSTEESDECSNFQFPKLLPGFSTIDDLTARLLRMDSNCSSSRLNGELNGTLTAEVKNRGESLTFDMMKCTNTLRILLIPYRTGQQLDVEDYEFSVEGRNAWLSYDASLYREDPVTYQPYYAETLFDSEARKISLEGGSGTVDHVVAAELSLSRLFYELGPRLIIRNKKNNEPLMDINLTWLLSLQETEDNKAAWGNQEFLDRQDKYSILFFVDGDSFIKNRIILNGWVLSLEDGELQ